MRACDMRLIECDYTDTAYHHDDMSDAVTWETVRRTWRCAAPSLGIAQAMWADTRGTHLVAENWRDLGYFDEVITKL